MTPEYKIERAITYKPTIITFLQFLLFYPFTSILILIFEMIGSEGSFIFNAYNLDIDFNLILRVILIIILHFLILVGILSTTFINILIMKRRVKNIINKLKNEKYALISNNRYDDYTYSYIYLLFFPIGLILTMIDIFIISNVDPNFNYILWNMWFLCLLIFFIIPLILSMSYIPHRALYSKELKEGSVLKTFTEDASQYYILIDKEIFWYFRATIEGNEIKDETKHRIIYNFIIIPTVVYIIITLSTATFISISSIYWYSNYLVSFITLALFLANIILWTKIVFKIHSRKDIESDKSKFRLYFDYLIFPSIFYMAGSVIYVANLLISALNFSGFFIFIISTIIISLTSALGLFLLFIFLGFRYIEKYEKLPNKDYRWIVNLINLINSP